MKKKFSNKPVGFKDTRKYTTRILCIFFGLFIIILVLVLNISKMNKTLKTSTKQYITDAIEQLSIDVAFRFDLNLKNVEQLANVIEQMPSHLIEEQFLGKKLVDIGFDQLFLVDGEGKTASGNVADEDIAQWMQKNEIHDEGSQIAYIGKNKLLFLDSVRKSGEPTQFLIGVCDTEKIQEFLKLAGFGEKGISYIVDTSGEVIISPSDSELFKKTRTAIERKMKETGEKGTKIQGEYRTFEQMVEDIQHHNSGLLYLEQTEETPLILSYYVFGINDWVLYSIIPQNLLIAESETYMQWTMVIIVSISVIMLYLLVYSIINCRRNQKFLEKIAFTDPLTGGSNNVLFQIQCKKVMEANPQKVHTMVFLNICGFKHINENFGVEEGNKILQYIYSKLAEHRKKNEFVTRSESDRFFLFLCESEEELVQKRLDEMLADIDSYSDVGDMRYSFVFQQGAYIIDNPELDIRIIQDRARVAAGYQTEKRQCVFYDNNLTEKVNWEMKMDSLFEESIQNGDFKIYLQPKVSLNGNEICGAEALVRWIHPEYGMIYPSDFVPLFEKNGKICKLDIYMFEEVCKMLHQWETEGRRLLPISVNLSRRNIGIRNFLQDYVEIKDKYEIPDSILEFELTESLFFDAQQIQMVKELMQEMHAHGFLCSLDDFGFGYSSLSLLKEVEIDTIKLDRQFFLGESDKLWKVVGKLISLAKELKIKVVAEGIELPEQIACLRERECDMIQGYIYSKPLVVSDFLKWLDMYESSEII